MSLTDRHSVGRGRKWRAPSLHVPNAAALAVPLFGCHNHDCDGRIRTFNLQVMGLPSYQLLHVAVRPVDLHRAQVQFVRAVLGRISRSPGCHAVVLLVRPPAFAGGCDPRN